ncbi:hypothetical protein F5B20DRAFT_584465 [Whalleya microplaca]|nr:hypothetical protein F5B20DRAFT_584465 [Whalleya microplaca]
MSNEAGSQHETPESNMDSLMEGIMEGIFWDQRRKLTKLSAQHSIEYRPEDFGWLRLKDFEFSPEDFAELNLEDFAKALRCLAGHSELLAPEPSLATASTPGSQGGGSGAAAKPAWQATRKCRGKDLSLKVITGCAPPVKPDKPFSQPVFYSAVTPTPPFCKDGPPWGMPKFRRIGYRPGGFPSRNVPNTVPATLPTIPKMPKGVDGIQRFNDIQTIESAITPTPLGVTKISDSSGLITPKSALGVIFPTPPTSSTSDNKISSERLDRVRRAMTRGKGKPPREGFNMITKLSGNHILVIALGKHLEPSDILTLYSVSRAFHDTVDGNLVDCVLSWARVMAPEAASIFRYGLYCESSVTGSVGRGTPDSLSHSSKTGRVTPSLKWLQMVVNRSSMACDILAHLARAGLRTPRNTHVAVLKTWLLMDVPHTWTRVAFARSAGLFTDEDLLNAQLFFVKLAMLFNDPLYGPNDCELLELFSAQKGWYPLWQMLFGHRYRTTHELLQLKVRYDADPDAKYQNEPILSVPATEVGKLYLEGWGKGKTRLLRPEQIIAMESTRRDLRLETHLLHLAIWGFVDQATGRNLAPTEEEIYMSNAEYKNRSIDTTGEFTETHCKKDRWHSLSDAQRQKIIREDELYEEHLDRRAKGVYVDRRGKDADKEAEKGAEESETATLSQYAWGPSHALSRMKEKQENWNKMKNTAQTRSGIPDEDDSDDAISVCSITSHLSTLSELWRPEPGLQPEATHPYGFPPDARPAPRYYNKNADVDEEFRVAGEESQESDEESDEESDLEGYAVDGWDEGILKRPLGVGFKSTDSGL